MWECMSMFLAADSAPLQRRVRRRPKRCGRRADLAAVGHWQGDRFCPTVYQGQRLTRMTIGKLAVLAGTAAAYAVGSATPAWAQVSKAFGTNGTLGAFLGQLSDKLDHTIQHIPKLGRYLLDLPQQ